MQQVTEKQVGTGTPLARIAIALRPSLACTMQGSRRRPGCGCPAASTHCCCAANAHTACHMCNTAAGAPRRCSTRMLCSGNAVTCACLKPVTAALTEGLPKRER